MELQDDGDGDCYFRLPGCADPNYIIQDYMELDNYWHVVIVEIDLVKELRVDRFHLKMRYDFRQYSEKEYLETEDDADILWIFAVKRGRYVGANIDWIDWKKTKKNLIRAASAIPKHWFAKNNFLHEVAVWIDGTVINAFHAQSVGMDI